jgi:hypothetical protein
LRPIKLKLSTPQWAYRFLLRFVSHFDLGHETQDTGILVLEPPNQETSSAATPMEVGLAAAIANAGSVGVA